MPHRRARRESREVFPVLEAAFPGSDWESPGSVQWAVIGAFAMKTKIVVLSCAVIAVGLWVLWSGSVADPESGTSPAPSKDTLGVTGEGPSGPDRGPPTRIATRAYLENDGVPQPGRALSPSQIGGRVQDTSGRPIPGARLLTFPSSLMPLAAPPSGDIENGALQRSSADGEGFFVVEVPQGAGAFCVSGSAPGFSPAVVLLHRADREVTLVLQRAASLSGRTRDIRGLPVPGLACAGSARRVAYSSSDAP